MRAYHYNFAGRGPCCAFLELQVPMLLLLASKEQRSSSITARSMCGVHDATRSMCGVAGCGILQEEHRRRRRPASVDHSEQTVNHNTTLTRKVDKTCQKYKHESALFSALFRARRAVLHDEERRCGRTVCHPQGWWAHKQTVTVKSISRFFGPKPPKLS